MDLELELGRILSASAWFRRVLDAARQAAPADWLVGGGVSRTLVWDHLHGQAESASGGDVDLVYFDPADLVRTGEAAYEAELRRALPEVDWDVKNQAAVHLWYARRFGHEIRPIASVEDGWRDSRKRRRPSRFAPLRVENSTWWHRLGSST